MRRICLGILGLAALLTACVPGRKSAAGFHLPGGDIDRGKLAFTELKCHACHEVAGVALPTPVAEPRVPVALGGIVPQSRTDGELVASIVDPSHHLVPGYDLDLVRTGSLSRMGDFSESMSVRQLIDLVAFLHSTYEVRPPVALP